MSLPTRMIIDYNRLNSYDSPKQYSIYGATKIDLSWIDPRSISVRFEKVFTLIYIDLSSHLSVHIQIALDLTH